MSSSAAGFFERYYALINEHDLRRVEELFTDDLEFDDDAWPGVIRGRAEMQRFLTYLWTAMPDLRFELVDGPYVGAVEGRYAVRVRTTGTMTGPMDPPGFAPTGREVVVEFAGFYELRDLQVCRARLLTDTHAIAVQVGAAPPSGSRGEKLGVAMQRIGVRLRRR